MAAAAFCSIGLQVGCGFNSDDPHQFAELMLITVTFTTAVWVGVTYATAPVPMEQLVKFYRIVHPDGPGWKAVAAQAGLPPAEGLWLQLRNWLLGVVMIYAALFGLGKLIFGSSVLGLGLLALSILAGWLIARSLVIDHQAAVKDDLDSR